MTWVHIPSSTASADTVDSASASVSLTLMQTSARSPILNGINFVNGSSRPGSKTATSMTLPSGMTSSPLTASPGVEQWILRLRASPANLTQLRGYERLPTDFPMNETSGPIHSESLGRWHPDSSSWRTSQASLWEVMDGHHMGAQWSESWPKQGMTRSGELYPLPMREPRIFDGAGGSWHIPTPTSADVYTGNMESSQQSDDSMHSVSLPDFVGRFPTPCAADSLVRNKMRPSQVKQMLPTPTGDDANNVTRTSGAFQSLSREVDGSLSPDWVSWLMGLPVGWTSLEPVPQEEYDQWFQSQMNGTWWQEEQGLPRVTSGIPDRVNRLKCLGNGIVPASLAVFLRGG